MDGKARTALEKALQEKSRGNHAKALERLREAVAKFPDEPELYLEAVECCLECGEPLQATQYLKKAHSRFPAQRERLDTFARDKAHTLNDPVLSKFVLESSIRQRDLPAAHQCLEDMQDRVVRDLLQRTRTKRQSLVVGGNGGLVARAENVTYALSEALMCLRLGRMLESVRSFQQILDEKPVENEVLEPFFASLERVYPKSGRIRVIYASSLLVSNHVEMAMQQLVGAVRIETTLADECLDRIRDVTATLESPPPIVEQAVVEILLAKGDLPRAAELLQAALASTPSRATEIMELLRPHLDSAVDTLVLHYLYMEAALSAEQTLRVLETLKAILRDEANAGDLMEWLDTRGKEQFFPPEIMMFQGELAIRQKKFARAVEIFSALCTASPTDTPTIVNLVERHMNADESLREFHRTHAAKDKLEQGSASSGADFEHFEKTEFSMNTRPTPPAPAPAIEKEPAKKTFSLGGPEDAHSTEIGVESEFGSSEFSLGSGGPTDNDPDFDNGGGKGIFRHTASEARPTLSAEPHAAPQPADSIEITEGHVRSVADLLLQSRAATFFHIEADKEPAEEVVPPPPTAEEKGEEEKPEVIAVMPVDDSFDARFQAFLDGKIDNAGAIRLLHEAVALEKAEESRELLNFRPQTPEEEFEHKRFQVEYQLLINRPAAALALLETIDPAQVSDEARKLVWTKTATCQRLMDDYEAAHQTLTKLVAAFPGSEDLERLARQNYRQHLENQSDHVPVLEKTSSLTDDL